MTTAEQVTRVRIQVEGVVQGVGFRPFVHALATGGELAGLVGNDAQGAFIEVEGAASAVSDFQLALRSKAPPLAVIDRVTVQQVAPTGEPGFRIAASGTGGDRQALIAADSATCDDCLRELTDPTDRRYGYPFINCTNCGPRFTIVRDVPYDRPTTTMAGFTLCALCRREYDDPRDRRFHAQPVCCADCGPRLRLFDGAGAILAGAGSTTDDIIAAATSMLLDGRIVAVKGLGGYHLAADATSAPATEALRGRKHREDKPFAVLVADLAMARKLAEISPADEELLTSPARPIVLVPRLAGDGQIAPAVAPGHDRIGLMLPYTPLHVLLMRGFARPLVLTSANVSDEPIAFRDSDALVRLAGIADAFLTHNRPIRVRVDDSVVRSFRSEPLVIRRSRGYAPGPIRLTRPADRQVLGCGAELKSTFCLAKGDRAVLSQHIGDLGDYETFHSFVEGVEHLGRLFGVTPELVAHDLHPDYHSTRYALELAETGSGVQLVGVQHHHAHIASCLVDNEYDGPVIGVAFDGTGYGTDGGLWGGEFLVADLAQSQRAGHLTPVAMPGGASAVRQPWRMAASYLAAAGERAAIADRHPREWDAVVAMAAGGLLAPTTSSAGRLFDAVACLAGVRDEVTYEGQAAVELEQLADRTATGGYQAQLLCPSGEPFQVHGPDLIGAVVADLAKGATPGLVSMRFHRAVAQAIVDGCEVVRDDTGLRVVALSGGVFQNVLLLELAVAQLELRGFQVLTHRRIPPNDGGISIGQVAVAAARDNAPVWT